MNFNDLKLVSFPSESKRTALQRVVDKRYVITCDPFDQKDGINTFHIYDRLNLGYTTKIETKKTFYEFVEWYSKKTSDIKMSYLTSTKFINNDGKVKSLEQIRTEFQSSQRYSNSI